MTGTSEGHGHYYSLPNGECLNLPDLPPCVSIYTDKEENWDSGHVWTPEQFSALNFCSNSIWFVCVKEVRPLWLNKSSQKRFKRQQHQLQDVSFENIIKQCSGAEQELLQQLRTVFLKLAQMLEEQSGRCFYIIGPDKFLTPWWALKSDAPGKEVCIKMRSVRLQIENSKVSNACMLQVVQELSIDQMRAVAMHHKNPLFTFMFDKKGNLLSLNMSAKSKYCKETTTLWDILIQGIFEGGESEAKSIYQEAITSVIDKQEIYRYYLQRRSSKDPSQIRWQLLEMWPLMDPVSEKPAMLVAMYNVTKLIAMQESLKQDQEAMRSMVEKERLEKERLQSSKMKLEAANWRLEQERGFLQTQIEEIMSGSVSSGMCIDTETPAEKTLDLLQKLMQNEQPSYPELKKLYDTISEQKDLRQPTNLQTELENSNKLDSEVSQAILQMLTDNIQVTTKANSDEEDNGSEGSLHSSSSGSLPHPKPYIHQNVEKILATSQTWNFNPFELAQASEETPLSALGFYLLKRSGLTSSLKLNETRLARFLCKIEEGYPQNPYHNRIHAADVLHKTDMLLRCSELMQCGIVDEIGQLACYLSAIIHDFEHKGVNNDYLIRTQDLLAIRYNDKSPLENHHLAASFHLLYSRELNFFGAQSKEIQDKIRSMMIDMVLATDMKQHFSILSRFQSLKFSNGYSLTRTRSSGSSGGHPTFDNDRPSVEQFQKLEDSNRTLILQVALKMADIGHLASKKELHEKWVYNLEEEFFQQGDQERALRLNVSPLMDRRKAGITLSQVGFFDIVALPLFQAFTQIFTGATPMYEQVQENYQLWVVREKQKAAQ